MKPMRKLFDLSCLIHNRIFDDVDESLCSRAWRLRRTSRFWAGWVGLFGSNHCRASFMWHHFKKFNI